MEFQGKEVKGEMTVECVQGGSPVSVVTLVNQVCLVFPDNQDSQVSKDNQVTLACQDSLEYQVLKGNRVQEVSLEK